MSNSTRDAAIHSMHISTEAAEQGVSSGEWYNFRVKEQQREAALESTRPQREAAERAAASATAEEFRQKSQDAFRLLCDDFPAARTAARVQVDQWGADLFRVRALNQHGNEIAKGKYTIAK